MMEWNSQDGIAKLLVGFEKKLHRSVRQDHFHLYCKKFLENMLGFLQSATEKEVFFLGQITQGNGMLCGQW